MQDTQLTRSHAQNYNF